MKNNMLRNLFIAIIGSLIAAFSAGVSAKSMYVIANINANPTPLQTYDIQLAPAYLVFQATANVPSLAGGAVGLGLDDNSAKLFVTYEGSNTIQLVDATTFAVLGTTSAPGASNLAGITVDQGNSRVYAVDRDTGNLYVYDWNAATDTLTQVNGGGASGQFVLAGVTGAHGLALDETRGRLYVGDKNTTTVQYFDTTTFAVAGSYVQALSGQTAMGIAVDSVRNIVYTGNAYGPYGSNGMLVKYDLNTATETFYTLPGAPVGNGANGDNIVGVAVDEDTGNVIVTTGNQGTGGTDTIIVFDSSLNVLKNDVGDIGNPTGIAIPRTQISYNPLNFSKTDSPDPVASGNDLTYTLCYDNAANASAVNNVLITDNIPAGTTFVSATGPFSTTPTTVTWSIASVPAGAAQVCYNLVVNVTAADGSTIVNSATIDSDETPPTTQTQTTAVGAGSGGIIFTGTGEGGASAGPLELLFGLLALPLILVRRMGWQAGSRLLSLAAMMIGAVTVSLALVVSSTAMAAGNGWYAGAGIGAANTDVKASDYDASLAALGYTATSTIDDSDTGWKLFGGYEFTKNWAVEGAYVDLGKVTSNTTVSAGPPLWTPQDFVNAAATVHPYSVDGFAITGKGTYPFGNGFSAFAKLGLFVWKADIEVRCVGCLPAALQPDGEDGADFTTGAGVGYDFANNFGVRAEWERFGTDRDDVDFFSASVLYRF